MRQICHRAVTMEIFSVGDIFPRDAIFPLRNQGEEWLSRGLVYFSGTALAFLVKPSKDAVANGFVTHVVSDAAPPDATGNLNITTLEHRMTMKSNASVTPSVLCRHARRVDIFTFATGNFSIATFEHMKTMKNNAGVTPSALCRHARRVCRCDHEGVRPRD